jgi:hypothetical protein
MRKYLLFALLLSFQLVINAQNYYLSSSLSRKALVYYYEDKNGFYYKKENILVEGIAPIVSFYGYNKKTHELYVETTCANCIVVVNEYIHKQLKKDKNIPQLKPEELSVLANAVNKKLAEKFEQKNKNRQKQIDDAREKAKRDSIRKAQEDSLRLVAEKNKETTYRNNHKWYKIPAKKKYIYCNLCEKNIECSDSIFCYSITNDTIYWNGYEDGRMGMYISQIHAGKLPNELMKDDGFVYHRKVFNDSLTTRIPMTMFYAADHNYKEYTNYLDKLRQKAPNGLFLNWGWNDEYSNITFHFEYLNTNKKTIKYIEVFFVVTNDVGDVRKTGSFRGTGPVEEWISANWSWEHSPYYVAGDASNMNITKVIITYTNGTKVTIPKNKLCFD